MTKECLYAVVESIRQYLGISFTQYPINFFAVCERINNLEVVCTPLKTSKLRGMVHKADEHCNKNVIIVNTNKSFLEQNYYCTHEFMHFFDDSKGIGNVLKLKDSNPLKPHQNDYSEWVANEGAAEFLVPYKAFIPLFCRLYDVYTDNKDLWKITYGNVTLIQELSERFAVTEMVIKNRVRNLSYEIDQYRNGVSVENICLLSGSKQASYNIRATDYSGILARTELMHDFEDVINNWPLPPISVGI